MYRPCIGALLCLLVVKSMGVRRTIGVKTTAQYRGRRSCKSDKSKSDTRPLQRSILPEDLLLKFETVLVNIILVEGN